MAGIQKGINDFISSATVNVPPIASQFDDTANDSDKSFTVPTNELWFLNWLHVIYVSSGDVGNRQLLLEVNDADGNTLIDQHAGAVQAASQTRHYGFLQGIYRETTFVDNSLQVSMPKDLYLGPGYVLRVYDDEAVAAAADDMTISFQYQKFTV